jgi:hypothetical protein
MKKLHLTLMDGKIYKVFGVASNILDKPGDADSLKRRGGAIGEKKPPC